MAGNLFRQTLTETVLRLVPLATRLNEKGVSLRFINFPGDWGYDGLNVDDDEARLRAVTPMGGTWIGAALERKVVGPLIRQLDAGEQLSPLLVSIITDGEVIINDFSSHTGLIVLTLARQTIRMNSRRPSNGANRR